MNIVDSSGWLEYFAEGENADFFASAIEDIDHLIVPVISVYEVFKKVLITQGRALAEVRVADMLKGEIVDLTTPIAMNAAVLSVDMKLPMADSIILATMQEFDARLWTQDAHFKGLPGVEYIEKETNKP